MPIQVACWPHQEGFPHSSVAPIQEASWPHQKEAFPHSSVAQCTVQGQPIAAEKRIYAVRRMKNTLLYVVELLSVLSIRLSAFLKLMQISS